MSASFHLTAAAFQHGGGATVSTRRRLAAAGVHEERWRAWRRGSSVSRQEGVFFLAAPVRASSSTVRKEGRTEGRKEGRKDRRNKGRKEERREGRNKGRKE